MVLSTLPQDAAPDSANAILYLVEARVLIEKGEYAQAVSPLNSFRLTTKVQNDTEYTLLNAVYLAFGASKTDDALEDLQNVEQNTAASSMQKTEAAYYMAHILLASKDEAQQKHGKAILDSLLTASGLGNSDTGIRQKILALAVDTAINDEDWNTARKWNDEVLAMKRSDKALLHAREIAGKLGQTEDALKFAQELAEKEPVVPQYELNLAESLHAAGRRADALKLIDNWTASNNDNIWKSRFYYLRSSMEKTKNERLQDLRTSLFLNPRSLETLSALFSSYNDSGDKFRAQHYLRQIAALDPQNPLVKKYSGQYGL
jgi:tetratricopeptide (TPR) repeat protein